MEGFKMNKKIIQIVCLILVLTSVVSCIGVNKHKTATDLTNEELTTLGITETSYGFRVYSASLMMLVSKFDTVDAGIDTYKNYAGFESKIIVNDPESPHFASKWGELSLAVFEPEKFLISISDKISVSRILCFEFEEEIGIYYETNKGKYVYHRFAIGGNEYGEYLIKYDELKKHADEILEIANTTYGSNFYSFFEDTFSDFNLNKKN